MDVTESPTTQHIGRSLRLLDSPKFKLLVKVGAVLVLGFLVNIISNAVSESASIGDLPKKLGWWILLAPLGVTMLGLDFLGDLRGQRGILTASRAAHRDSLERVVQTNERVTASTIQLLARSTKYRVGLNIHLFHRQDVDGRTALVKDRKAVYETEHLPVNHTLDVAYPDTDELVICDSFNRDEIIYEALPPTHLDRYNERIRNKVDFRIGWVLACPMHNEHARPAGVICAFGERIVFHDEPSRRHFESLMSLAGDVLAAGRKLADQERRKADCDEEV
jgi:hypothetical protein